MSQDWYHAYDSRRFLRFWIYERDLQASMSCYHNLICMILCDLNTPLSAFAFLKRFLRF